MRAVTKRTRMAKIVTRSVFFNRYNECYVCGVDNWSDGGNNGEECKRTSGILVQCS